MTQNAIVKTTIIFNEWDAAEWPLRPSDSIRGRHIFVYRSTVPKTRSTPPIQATISPISPPNTALDVKKRLEKSLLFTLIRVKTLILEIIRHFSLVFVEKNTFYTKHRVFWVKKCFFEKWQKREKWRNPYRFSLGFSAPFCIKS